MFVPSVGTPWRGLKVLVRDPRMFYHRVSRLLRPMRADYRRRLGISLKQWILYHQEKILFEECYWMGARALKNPLDAWIYQEIVYEAQPDVILEIGSMFGGSTLYLANLLDLLGKGRVISVDIDRSKFSVKHPRITEITGASSSPEVIAQVFQLCHDKSVLIIQDAAHDKEGVLQDLRNYSKLVSLNSYFIVEDGIIDLFSPKDIIGAFWEGPLAATEEFLRENPNFVADAERERYYLTANPRGFLKRIR
jgi:cephalosporin hydroxylase